MKTKLRHALSGVILLLLPNVYFGQTPDLGTASTFALFTSVGAFDNVGTTDVTGDVGTNTGAFNAFPPGTVNGQTHVEDASSLQAATDVDVAYSYLSGLTCGSAIGLTLGNDQVLTPNVYCLGGAPVTLNGDLTLDGQGDSDALFVFQIDGSLSANTLSNVILINSACLSNVYWQINGVFNLGDNSVFRGTVVANGAVNLFESASLLGRGLSRAGAISLNNNMVDISLCYTLPIELLSFQARPVDDYVQINWSTASETNNDYYTIERNFGLLMEWDFVNIVQGAGNSSSISTYEFIDSQSEIFNRKPGTIFYYRLKQTDLDGKSTYSKIVTVNFDLRIGDDFNLCPNPFNTSVTITKNGLSQINKVVLRIYSVIGEEVMNEIISGQVTTLETGNLPPGIYFYKLVLPALVSSGSGREGVIANSKIIQSGKLISKQ